MCALACTPEERVPKIFDTRSVLSGTAIPNNPSKGWNNRFQRLVARRHPSIYSFLKELRREQAAVEYMLSELSSG